MVVEVLRPSTPSWDSLSPLEYSDRKILQQWDQKAAERSYTILSTGNLCDLSICTAPAR